MLCHNDIHPRNVLIDTEQRFWIIDWDEVLLAPRECDLMFGVGGLGSEFVGPRETAWFLRGYGGATIDPDALAYYRLARALADIGAYAEQLLLQPDVGEASKRNAVQRLNEGFAPGNIVSLVHEASPRAP